MAIAQKLEVRQSQSLVMTQSLRQSIELLQMSALELTEFVNQEAEKNPLLSVEYQGDDDAPTPRKNDDESDDGDENEWEEKLISEDDNIGATDSSFSLKYDTKDYDDDSQSFEKYVSKVITLKEHLEEQLYVDITEPVQRIVALHLIDMVDEAGYLSEDMDQLHTQLGCEKELIESTIKILQKFDPAGVFARNLSECLELQLREKNRFDPAMEIMIANLDLLAKKDLRSLHKICGVDMEDIHDMVAEIKGLNPKPGLAFASADSSVILPDVIVTRQQDKWVVELNPQVIPKVLVNSGYFDDLQAKAKSKDDKKYINESFGSANWLVKAVEQRAINILKVANEIVARQQDFLKYGVTYLKPMVLKDIAETVGVHESTVSRVTASKYLQTPRGTYEMKYFFTSGIGNSFGGDTHSSEAVKHKIKQMIDAENHERILSDDDIADALKDSGMDIARRTVAKYRESMNMGSSVQRRREKALMRA